MNFAKYPCQLHFIERILTFKLFLNKMKAYLAKGDMFSHISTASNSLLLLEFLSAFSKCQTHN
jgi:hypothetical protein